MKYVNGYDAIDILAGQGTIGLEVLEQVEGVDPQKSQSRETLGSKCRCDDHPNWWWRNDRRNCRSGEDVETGHYDHRRGFYG